jgi:hypothetical protein
MVAEVDFLTPLSMRGVAQVVAGCLLGGLLGWFVGHSQLTQYEATAVVRVATVGIRGPVMPLEEARSWAESHAELRKELQALNVPDIDHAVNRYHSYGDFDESHQVAVINIRASGPRADVVQGICDHMVQVVVEKSHDLFVAQLKDIDLHFQQAQQAAESFQKVSEKELNLGSALTAQQTSASMELQRWAGELGSTLRYAKGEVVASRDSEVIDPPFMKENGQRSLLLAALGAFAGMLLGLGWASRRRSA